MNDHLTEAVERLRAHADNIDDNGGSVDSEEGTAIAADLRLLLSALRDVPEGWRPIDSAPKDRLIEVYCPDEYGLNPRIILTEWYEGAGFHTIELRHPSHWREHSPPFSETGGTDGG